MKTWNEDNFLEEILPLLHKKQVPGRCPDAETLSAIATDDVTEIVKTSFATHKAVCPECASLHERLCSFDNIHFSSEEQGWEQTEKRLDRWVASVLDSGGTVQPAGHHHRESGLRVWWQRFTERPWAFPTRWLLVPAALALVICAFLAGRVSVRPAPHVIAEVTPREKATTSPTAPTVPIVPSQARSTPQRPQGAPRIRPGAVPPTAVASAPPPEGRGVQSPGTEASTENAAILPSTSTPEPPKSAGASASTASTNPQSESPVQAEQTPSANDRTTPTRPPAPGAIRAGQQSGIRSAFVLRPGGAPSAAKTLRAPAEIRLESGTRVWIALRAVRKPLDGVSEFGGVVLLPVTQSGTLLLARNTQVSGTITVRNGKRTIQILEFLSPSAHYRLKSPSGEANLRLLGAGEVVEFDAGRVLETWMMSGSTYEKLQEPKSPER